MREYRKNTIRAIRNTDPRFNDYDDSFIAALYIQWGEETMSAGWPMHNDVLLNLFTHWAFNSPVELLHEQRDQDAREL